MDFDTKKRVSYYWDDEIGLFTFNKGHPMRPLRMKVTDELIKVSPLQILPEPGLRFGQ